MTKIQKSGFAGKGRIIDFKDAKGKITHWGSTEPHTLNESVWDVLIEISGRDPGWSVFGLSIMHGYHNVTLTLDNNNPSNPRFFGLIN